MLDGPQIGQIYPHAVHCSHTAQVSQTHQIMIQHSQTQTPLPLQQFFGKHLMRSSRQVHPTLRTAMKSGASLRISSLKQHKLSWVLRNEMIGICLMRTMSTSLSCYMRRTGPMWSGKITIAPNPRQPNLNISEVKLTKECVRCKTIDGMERQIECKVCRLKHCK